MMYQRKLNYMFHYPISGFALLRAIHASVQKADGFRLVMEPQGFSFKLSLVDTGFMFPDVAVRTPESDLIDTGEYYRDIIIEISVDETDLDDVDYYTQLVGMHFARFTQHFGREVRFFSHPVVGLIASNA